MAAGLPHHVFTVELLDAPAERWPSIVKAGCGDMIPSVEGDRFFGRFVRQGEDRYREIAKALLGLKAAGVHASAVWWTPSRSFGLGHMVWGHCIRCYGEGGSWESNLLPVAEGCWVCEKCYRFEMDLRNPSTLWDHVAEAR